MTDDTRHSLVPRPPDALTQTSGDDHSGVVSRMTEGVLDVVRAKERELAAARFRIGEYEFRGPDYRQILRWAEALDLSPEQVLAVLEASEFQAEYREIDVEFGVVDGALSSLAWDLTKLPLDEFAWDDEVRVHTMAFLSGEPLQSAPRGLPPNLRTLVFERLGLDGLDLSRVPELIELHCALNSLTDLDLSAVPQLTMLLCYNNQLTELDLSAVPQLTWLWCYNNLLTELDLSAVPQLTWLWCGSNELTELDIHPLQHLQYLSVDARVRIIGTPPEGCEIVRV